MKDASEKFVIGPKQQEIQIKIKGTPSEEILIKLGAQRLSKIEEVDTFYSISGSLKGRIHRIRDQDGEKTITIREYKHKKEFTEKISKQVYSSSVKGIENYIKKENLKLIGVVSKTRIRYRLGIIDICIDEVRGLGHYTEIQSNKPMEQSYLLGIINMLGLNKNSIERRTYISLILVQKRSKLFFILHKIAEKSRNLAFGITSGVMTTMGIIIGVWFGSKERIAVISGIFAVAAADSFSDAMGMYNNEKMAGKAHEGKAIKKAFITFSVKALMALTFVIPFFFLSEQQQILAIAIDIIWAILVISLFGLQIAAIESSQRPFITILRQIMVALIIGILAFCGSRLVNFIVSYLK